MFEYFLMIQGCYGSETKVISREILVTLLVKNSTVIKIKILALYKKR